MKHLKVFGVVVYAHIPAETRTKLDDRAQKTIFICYKQGGYKLFSPVTKKVFVSRDVTFAEDEAWNWSDNSPEDHKKKLLVSILEEESEGSITNEEI